MKRTSSHRAARPAGTRHSSSSRHPESIDTRSRSLSSRSDLSERHRTYSSSRGKVHKIHDVRPSYYRESERHDGGGPFARTFGSSVRDPSQMCQLRVANLTAPLRDHTVKRDLVQLFRKYGDCSVYVLSQRGDAKEAYVTYWSKGEARDARRALSKFKLYDRVLDIAVMREPKIFGPGGLERNSSEMRDNGRRDDHAWRHGEDQRSHGHRPMSPMYVPDEGIPTRTLFVGNLDLDVQLHELRDMFGKFGRVEDVNIKRPAPRATATYAFVKFSEVTNAQRAKTEMQSTLIGHHRIRLGFGKGTPSNRVYVSGLGEWTTLDWLEREFDRFGAIRRVEYQTGDDHAIVEFDNMDGAAAAAREMTRNEGESSGDRKISVTFADAMDLSVFRGGLRSMQDAADAPHSTESEGSRRHEPVSSGGSHRSSRSVKEDSLQRTRPSGLESRKRSHERTDGDGSREAKQTARSRTPERESEDVSLLEIAEHLSPFWNAAFDFKGFSFPLRVYLINGNEKMAEKCLSPLSSAKQVSRVALTQRLRLNPPKLEEVSRRVTLAGPSRHCWLLALPSSDLNKDAPENESLPNRPLRNLALYLKQSQSAAVAHLSLRTSSEELTSDQWTSDAQPVLHAFPPCDFSQDYLKTACKIDGTAGREDHLVLLIV